jgi:hypothetical protein
LCAYFFRKAKVRVDNFDTPFGEGDSSQVAWQKFTKMQYIQEGKQKVFMNGELLTSSHYYLGFSFPDGGECVDFNFSIPKIVYGTNIIQFVQHDTENGKMFSFLENKRMDFNEGSATWTRLMEFLSMFFEKEIGIFYKTELVGDQEVFVLDADGNRVQEKVSMRDVEIRSFDICWNQYFLNKEDALKYLEAQKNQRKKHARYTSQAQKDFDTSVYYVTADYSAKIYHKGSDYIKTGVSNPGERVHHRKINKRYQSTLPKLDRDETWNTGIFDCNKLLAHADRILRYEIHFRNSYMSKIFRDKVFRRKSERWEKKMKLWRELDNLHSNAFKKSTKKLTEAGKVRRSNWYKKWMQRSKSERHFWEWWRKKKQQRLKFFVEIPRVDSMLNRGIGDKAYRLKNPGEFEYFQYEKKEILRDGYYFTDETEVIPDVAEFSRYFYLKCNQIFQDFREQFILKHTHTLSQITQKVIDYNKTVDDWKKLPRFLQKPEKIQKRQLGRVRQMVALMQNFTFTQMVNNGMIHRNTALKYKKMLLELNANVTKSYDMPISTDSEGFEWYHESLRREGLSYQLRNRYFH